LVIWGAAWWRCLLKAGHRLKVYNRGRDKAEKLAAVVADRPGDACRSDAIITMLADDGAVEGVTFGQGNILASLGLELTTDGESAAYLQIVL
jgi:3-hydroxyisobutyrate dehydrogenase-like beta-hydroxyacid dehydrogenase